MTQFLKKQAAGFYLSALSILLAVVSAIACAVLAQDGENTPALIYLLTAAGVVLTLAAAGFSRTRTGLAVYNTSPAAAAVLYALCLAVLLLGRLEWLGGLMAHNANFAPMHTAFYVTIALYVVTMLISIAASFCKQVRD